MTVGLTFNGCAASSISDLLTLAVKTSVGGTACSYLPWPDVLPPLAMPSLYSLTPPFILRQRQPHTATGSVNPRTPLRVGIHLHRLPWLHVVPFLGLVVIHRLDALDAAWSTNDNHRKRTLGGEVDSWTHQLHLGTQGSASLLLVK